MNIERTPHVPNRLLTQRELERRMRSFADVLAHGRWLDEGTHMVEATQCVVERYGDELTRSGAGPGGEDLDFDPVFNEITVSFSAVKQVEEEDGVFFVLPRYTITSTINQDVDKNEVPSHVLDEIFSDAKEEENPGHEMFEDAGLSDLLERDSPSLMMDEADNLDQFQIKRQQELEYTVLFDGHVEDYSIGYSYSFDDVTLHDASYRLSDGRVLLKPVRYGDQIVDHQPLYVPALTSESFQEHLKTLDSRIDGFFAEQTLRDLEKVADVSPEEHIQRIFGMLAMASSGYAPIRWYKRAYHTTRRSVEGIVAEREQKRREKLIRAKDAGDGDKIAS